DPDYIKQSFKCCDISTAQERSEEDIMFDYDWVKNLEAQNKCSNYIYDDANSTSDNE
ncbi:17029_t:CDS:1, partial [Cetraspora pellucida]